MEKKSLVGVFLILFLVGFVIAEDNESVTCETDDDCVFGIKIVCCPMPFITNKQTAEADENILIYDKTKSYSEYSAENCSGINCSAIALDTSNLNCINNECSNDPFYCNEDTDCNEGYECDVGICVLEEETEEDKVCCKKIYSKGKQETRYNLIEESSCVSSNSFEASIVDYELCGEKKQAIQEKNRLRFEERTGQECADDCICTGVVMKCQLEGGGREMTVYSRSGNIIIQVKGVNMSTKVELYHHNNKTYGDFNGVQKSILMPDQIKEKIQNRIKQKTCECDEMELTEDALYKVQTKKKARLFWIFPVREKSRVEINAENGEIIKFRNPWWGFLANDIEEE